MLSSFDNQPQEYLFPYFVTLNRAFCILETQCMDTKFKIYSEKKQSIIVAVSTYDTT